MQILGPSLDPDIVADARAAEAFGYAGIRVLGHLYCEISGGPINTFDHPLIALSAAATATDRVILTQTVLDVSRRHQTEVTQAIATLDRTSGGRAELGIGAGWYEPGRESIGFDLGAPGVRVERLLEGLVICRTMFDQQGRVDLDGTQFVANVDHE